MKYLTLLLSVLLLVACAGSPQADAPTAVPSQISQPPTATTAPTPTLAPPTAIPQPEELAATVLASLPATPTPEPNQTWPGLEGVDVQALRVPTGWQPLWFAATRGMAFAAPDQQHMVAIYTYTDQGWQEIDRIMLEDQDTLFEGSVSQVELEPSQVWLQIEAAAGAHGGCYTLLRFDGQSLHTEATSCNSNPVAGWLQDTNGDGTPEVVLNQTDFYVFCYACGVRLVNYDLLYWDGRQMQAVELKTLTEASSEDVLKVNNRAVELAEHGLWKEAEQLLIEQLPSYVPDEAVNWNIAYIKLVAEGRAEQAETSPYPLLDRVFYGDYGAALDIMRAYTPEQIFSADTPLIVGTVGEMDTETISTYIIDFAGRAVQARPDLADAYFLRAWAQYQLDPSAASVLADVQQAAQLATDEPLFADSLTFLQQ
jgi:hypothetical protein